MAHVRSGPEPGGLAPCAADAAGQLGNPTTTDSPVPVGVAALHSVFTISADSSSAFVLDVG